MSKIIVTQTAYCDTLSDAEYAATEMNRAGNALIIRGLATSISVNHVDDDFCELEAPDQERLYASTDAVVWAEEFAKVCPEVDKGLMIGWFANAFVTAERNQDTPKPEVVYKNVLCVVAGEHAAPYWVNKHSFRFICDRHMRNSLKDGEDPFENWTEVPL